MKKIRVLKRFVERGVLVRHPGEVLEVSPEAAEQLIERGIAKAVESRKRKEPAEDKALRPSEDKIVHDPKTGKSDEGESA